MSQRSSRALLNHLIETCNDGAHGFQHAADLVTDAALKTQFAELARSRARIADQLLPHAQRFGGDTASDGTAAAALHRKWMDVRSTWSSHDDRTILTEVQRGDAVTMAAFKDALDGVLPSSVRDLVERQYSELRGEHDQLGRSLTETK